MLTRLRLCRILLGGILLVSACDGPRAPTDAPSVADFDAGARMEPTVLVMTCPEGWRSRELHGATICEPWAADEAPRCPDGQLAVPGQPAGSDCQPVWPCPSGAWPDDAPADSVFFRPDAVGGDGSRDAPFGAAQLSDALAAARSRAVALVLGEGELVTGIDVAGIPRVLGLCPERTRIRSAGVSLGVTRGTTEIRGLSVESSDYIGMEIGRSATVSVSGVAARGGINGIRVRDRGVLTGDRVLLRGPVIDDPSSFVPALQVMVGGQATLRHADLSGGGGAIATPAPSDPPRAEEFGTVTLEDSVMHDVPYGVLGAIDFTLRRVAVERASLGLLVLPFRTASLEDVRIRAIGETTYSGGSFGLSTVGVSLTLRRVAISDVRGYAISVMPWAEGPAVLDAEDLFVSDTDAVRSPTWRDRIAMLVSGVGTSADLRRAHFAAIGGNAIQVEHGTFTARDLRVLDARVAGDGTWGHALQAYRARVTLERFEATPELFGLFVLDDAQVDVTDFELGSGVGVQVQCSADCSDDSTVLRLSRASLHDLRRVALLVTDATAEIRDVEIRGIRTHIVPIAVDDVPGTGLAAVSGVVRAERVTIEDVQGLGILAYDGASITAAGLTVRDLSSVDCECGPNAYGDGVLWTGGASVSLSGLLVERAERGGLVAAVDFGTFDLAGVVRGSGIGIITDPRTPADLSAFATVQYGENDVPSLPVEITIGESESSPWRYAPASNADPSRIGF